MQTSCKVNFYKTGEGAYCPFCHLRGMIACILN
nr:MAG TPA: Putative toxin VapC6 domain, ZN ribbon domain [Caudoviricetes sp.]